MLFSHNEFVWLECRLELIMEDKRMCGNCVGNRQTECKYLNLNIDINISSGNCVGDKQTDRIVLEVTQTAPDRRQICFAWQI